IDLGEIKLQFEDKFWNIKSDIYKNWLIVKQVDNKIKIGLDFEGYKKYLEEKIIKDVNVEVQDAKFLMKGGKVSEFKSSQDGRQIDLEKTLELVENNLNDLIKESEIIVNISKSEVSTKDINDLGIKEIIGTGFSDFKGSPKNRIHNIKTGAAKLNGLLIKPGEEFYTIKNLLPIDAEGGYLPELVIKGNRTIPEYGGGLCQIGTTMFRAAVESGLNITQRRPHSYRVVYYEPAGTDATIYDPMPDLRFINDTSNYILIQARIEGTKLYFDFWGTKDGRVVSVGKPVIYNIVKPGPTKMIQSTELKPGEKNCIESAHNGADAYFDYNITYSDGTKHEERFSSHYVPWQAVCLVGATASSTTSGGGGSTGSSTTSTIE
ncbi:MAG TPA: VanW family protein, partial [bacterium]|nr:VanW family protein [bacterium]